MPNMSIIRSQVAYKRYESRCVKRKKVKSFDEVKENLLKRRKMMFPILLLITCLALLVEVVFHIEVSSSLDASVQMYMVFGMIAYKIVELFAIYHYFYKRYWVKYLQSPDDSKPLQKFDKNGKRFFMLVPHGNVIFGMITYKLSGEIGVFLLFMLFAVVTLLLVNPKNLYTEP